MKKVFLFFAALCFAAPILAQNIEKKNIEEVQCVLYGNNQYGGSVKMELSINEKLDVHTKFYSLGSYKRLSPTAIMMVDVAELDKSIGCYIKHSGFGEYIVIPSGTEQNDVASFLTALMKGQEMVIFVSSDNLEFTFQVTAEKAAAIGATLEEITDTPLKDLLWKYK